MPEKAQLSTFVDAEALPSLEGDNLAGIEWQKRLRRLRQSFELEMRQLFAAVMIGCTEAALLLPLLLTDTFGRSLGLIRVDPTEGLLNAAFCFVAVVLFALLLIELIYRAPQVELLATLEEMRRDDSRALNLIHADLRESITQSGPAGLNRLLLLVRTSGTLEDRFRIAGALHPWIYREPGPVSSRRPFLRFTNSWGCPFDEMLGWSLRSGFLVVLMVLAGAVLFPLALPIWVLLYAPFAFRRVRSIAYCRYFAEDRGRDKASSSLDLLGW